jgi:hypothetical protein
MSKRNKSSAVWRNLQITVAIPGTSAYHSFMPLNYRTITAAVASVNTHMSNSTDILVSQMIMISSYIICECDGHWWVWVLFKKHGTIGCTYNSHSHIDHIVTYFGLREMIVAALKIMVFCSPYLHPALREAKHLKYYQNYYPKLRRNIGVDVFINEILTTH